MNEVIEVFEAHLCTEVPLYEEPGQYVVTDFTNELFLTYGEAEAYIRAELTKDGSSYEQGNILKTFMRADAFNLRTKGRE